MSLPPLRLQRPKPQRLQHSGFPRYPGSKAKLRDFILTHFPVDVRLDLWSHRLPAYCEPFFGSGAIGWSCVLNFPSPQTRVIVADLDPGIVDMWKAVRDAHQELIRHVRDFAPTKEAFYTFQKEDGRADIDPVEHGFRKLALHMTSFSGLGYKAGGPLGGKSGRSEYNPECRWKASRLEASIQERHRLMQRFWSFDVYCEDFAVTLARMPQGGFAYLDPPYYEKGGELYKFPFDEGDHERLAGTLRDAGARYRWLLSYDDHPRIRKLYSWATIESFSMTPTVQTAKAKMPRRKNREIVITPPEA